MKESLIYLLILLSFAALSSNALATAYTRCNANQQAVDEAGNHRPDYDEICQLKTADELGPAYVARCTTADDIYCQGHGPGSLVKPRDIPNGGIYWYAAIGIGAIQNVRCVCGCFVGSTEILTNFGWHAIDRLLANSNRFDISIALPEMGKDALSAVRRGKDFVKGPEEIPVLRITTQNGKTITLTEKHPIVIAAGNVKKMIQAKALKSGDRLFTVDGKLTNVTSIVLVDLPKGDNFVYNLHTGNENGSAGIIAANGLRVGDLTWQLRLSERESREENLLAK